MKSQTKKAFDIVKYLRVVGLSILVIIIGVFFMSKKEDLDFDEVLSFGLANNTFQLDVEDFKEYNGEELLIDYAAVKNGEEFNVSNVFFNQTQDTHPPFYYLLLNFVSSLKKESFSMWHGLIINLFFMIILFFEMRYLFHLVINDKVVSTILSLISFCTYGFINEIVFIRMYVVLSAISMGFIIIIANKIKELVKKVDVDISKNSIKTIDFKFLIAFYIICVLGILTQYHYVLVAFYFSLVFAIFLLYKKEIKLLLLTLLSGILSILTSFLIFPGMMNHLFGEGSLHALNGQRVDSLAQRFYEMLLTIKKAFFDVGIYPYIVILLIIIVISLIIALKKKVILKEVIVNNIWYFIVLVCVIYYYIVISITTTFTFARYLYNIYPLIIISIIAPIYILLKIIKPNLKYLSAVVLIMLAITSRLKEEPFSLNQGQNLFYEYLTNNRETKVLALYRSIDQNGRSDTMKTSLWKIQRPVYTFRSIKNISFVDMSRNEDVLYKEDTRISANNRLFVVIYTEENDDDILEKLMKNSGFVNVDKVIRTTYYNMYVLNK